MSAIDDLIAQVTDEKLRALLQREADKLKKGKKFGLVFEPHLPERTLLHGAPVRVGSKVTPLADRERAAAIDTIYTVTRIDGKKAWCAPEQAAEDEEGARCFFLDDIVPVAEFGEPIYPWLQRVDAICNAPESALWHTLIEAENYHALQTLAWLYAGQVDCIYIDPPYNTGAKDWKYNNDYVDSSDAWRHSKWLAMMERRLKIAKKLLNPRDSVLIVTIDEKEYLHLGCLLEKMFPGASIQMVTSVINQSGVARVGQFYRADEYIFFVFIGAATVTPVGENMLAPPEDDEGKRVDIWNRLLRRGTDARREDSAKQFYPFWIDVIKECIHSVGDYIPLGFSRDDVVPPAPGLVACWPIRSDDSEGRWQIGVETARKGVQEGTVRLGAYNRRKDRWSISYLRNAEKERIKRGEIEITGKDENGVLILKFSDSVARVKNPVTVWNQRSHNAGVGGSQLLNKLFGGAAPFSFPKSLYAVHDALRFFVAKKPNALILDFFAGSGTTLHAVNLLNAADGGQRRCILVTNNEVSAEEENTLRAAGHKPGDDEWEKLGIARHVTWPRTVCSIRGENVHGEPLKGQYLGTERDMAAGFAANAIYFKLGFLDKTSVALGRQFTALLPLLWLKAGAVGECPQLDATAALPPMLLYPASRFAVLLDEKHYAAFRDALAAQPDIDALYFVTDSESAFKNMAASLRHRAAWQLYRDYLDNFRINVEKTA